MKASIPGTVRGMRKPSDVSPRRLRGRVAALLVLAVIVSTVAVTGLLWVRSHGFSARAKPGAFETAVARAVRSLAVPPAVRDLANPLQPTELRLARARDHFADHCATCHANDGSGKTMVNEGLYPPAHDLRSADVQRMPDGELFHVIREGVRFTGMPGWGGDEETNWELVLFVRHLPRLTAEEDAMMREVNGERY